MSALTLNDREQVQRCPATDDRPAELADVGIGRVGIWQSSR